MPSQTGPTTPEGKAIASRNATTHGLTSSAPVIPGIEEPADWQRHLQGMMESLQPEGWHETVLVERIAHFLWRSFRAVRQELAQIDALQSSAKSDLQIAEAYSQGTLAKGIFPDISEEEVAASKSRRVLPLGDNLARQDHTLRGSPPPHVHPDPARTGGHPGPPPRRAPTLARLDISGPPIG